METRFSKIRSHNSRLSKVMTLFMTIAVIITMLCANVVMAMVGNEEAEQFKIEIKHGDTVLQLNNKPYVYDNTVYIPLRELFEKIGLMENESSYINWDNGKIEMLLIEKTANAEQPETEIKYLSYNYGIEIGKAEYKLNPSMEAMYQQKWNISNSKQMSHAPMLKDGVTYIPFEFVEYLVNRPMQTSDVTCSAWDLAYNDSTDRKADYINDSIGIDYANYYGEFQYDVKGFDVATSPTVNTKNKSAVKNAFFEAFEMQDFNTMKKYCTENFIEKYYTTSNAGEILVDGMSWAKQTGFSMAYDASSTNAENIAVIIEYRGSSQTNPPAQSLTMTDELIIYFVKDADGNYLINDFKW